MKEVIWTNIMMLPALCALFFIIWGHKNCRKAKKLEADTGKRFWAMYIVSVLHAICGYVILLFYGLAYLLAH